MSTKRRQPVRTGTEVWPGRGGRGRSGVAQGRREAGRCSGGRGGVRRNPRRVSGDSGAAGRRNLRRVRGVPGPVPGSFRGRHPSTSRSQRRSHDLRASQQHMVGVDLEAENRVERIGLRAQQHWLAEPTPDGFRGRYRGRIPRPVPGRFPGGHLMACAAGTGGFRGRARQDLRRVFEKSRGRCPKDFGAGPREFPTPAPDGFRSRCREADSKADAHQVPKPAPDAFRRRYRGKSRAGARRVPRLAPDDFRGRYPGGLQGRCPMASAADTPMASATGVRWLPGPMPGGFRGRCPMAPPPMPGGFRDRRPADSVARVVRRRTGRSGW